MADRATALSPAKAAAESPPRADARLKVTGQARIARTCRSPIRPLPVWSTSAIARGAISTIDLEAARAVPGVLDILTYENANVVKPIKTFSEGGQAGTSIVPLSGPKIWHDGQIIAMVVAETFEAASEAARLIRVELRRRRAERDLRLGRNDG